MTVSEFEEMAHKANDLYPTKDLLDLIHDWKLMREALEHHYYYADCGKDGCPWALAFEALKLKP